MITAEGQKVRGRDMIGDREVPYNCDLFCKKDMMLVCFGIDD